MMATRYEWGGVFPTSSSVSSPFLLGLTLMSWSGQKQTRPGISNKTGGFLAQESHPRCAQRLFSGSLRVLWSRLFKECGLIAGLVQPHPIHAADPDVGPGPNGHTVTFPLGPFALIIVARPGFLLGRLPGELVQDVAQGLQTRQAFVGFGEVATLERHGSCPSQGLNTVGISIAGAIIAPCCQEANGDSCCTLLNRGKAAG